uniref:CCHC-type domain-containing protein n=1 Tax=Aegilops tauschii subsp. strangulata TaxID=200361 RepID=A0A453JMH1_AEGTS
LPSPAPRYPLQSPQLIQMKTNGSSAKSQEIGSKRKWKNQHEHTEKHIAWHSFGYQGHYPQQRPARDKKNGVITCLVCGKEGHYSRKCLWRDRAQYQYTWSQLLKL